MHPASFTKIPLNPMSVNSFSQKMGPVNIWKKINKNIRLMKAMIVYCIVLIGDLRMVS